MTHTAPIRGRCSVCREMVPAKTPHSCSPRAYIDYSWSAIHNPDNTPWLPGYRFLVMQDSRRTGRLGVHKVHRTYRVFFEIDQDGVLTHTRGPKPTEGTWAGVRALYAKERPGSNGGPPL